MNGASVVFHETLHRNATVRGRRTIQGEKKISIVVYVQSFIAPFLYSKLAAAGTNQSTKDNHQSHCFIE